MSDAAQIIAKLKYVEKNVWLTADDVMSLNETMFYVYEISRENARLTAEIKRLTRKMTWKEAVDILNKYEYQGHSNWENPFLTRGDDVEFELFAVARWLEITNEVTSG